MPLILVLLIVASSSISALAQSTDDLFNGDVLQEIRIEMHPKDWETLKANPGSNTYYPCNFKWRGLVLENVGIRQRGGSTRNSIKPGLRVDFNQYDAKQQFLGLKSLALDNMAQDASMMKERLSMELFAKMGLPAAREVNARLYVNDRYAGLYTIVESTDKDFLKRTFGENDGYLYEYAASGHYRFEYLGSDASLYSPKLFDPKTHEKDPDPAPIEAMIRTMNSAPDAEFATAMAPYLDLPLFMKHLAVEDFLAETDGILTGMNNFYLYRFEKKNVSQFIVHDKDLTFGGAPNKPNRYSSPFLVLASKNVLIRRAMNVTEARNAYFDTLRNVALAAGSGGGWLESEITRIYNQIRNAAYDDTLKVCFDGVTQHLCTDADFEAEVAANLDFARRRSASAVSQLIALSNVRFFAINDLGGYSLTRGDSTRSLQAGYGVIESDAPIVNPEGVAIFSFRQNGVIVSETSVQASTAVQRGILYAEVTGTIKTGIAIANPGDQAANVSFSYKDANGSVVGQGSIVVPARGQIARFLDQDPFNSSAFVRGTFSFESSLPVFAVALRGFTNERSEFILSTLPVVDLTTTPDAAVIPHFADGEGWTTQIILVNPSDQTMQGTIRFIDKDGSSSSSYMISPRSYYRMQTSGTSTNIRSGWVQVLPAANDGFPAASGIFSFRRDGVTVTEASVRALPLATVWRTYIGMSDGVQSGIAIANPSSASITVNVEATTLSGAPAGFSGTLTVPGNGQVASFLGQIPGFERISAPFEGILRVSTSTTPGIAIAGLRGRTNERGDFLIATVPSVDENASPSRTQMVFPHFVEGSGYMTQFILFSGAKKISPTGTLRLVDQTGLPISAW